MQVAGDFSKAHPTTHEEVAQVVCVPWLQIIAHPVCALDVHGFECVAAAMDADTRRKDSSCTAKGGQSWKPLTEVWQRPRAEQVDDEHIEFLGGGEKAAYREEGDNERGMSGESNSTKDVEKGAESERETRVRERV